MVDGFIVGFRVGVGEGSFCFAGGSGLMVGDFSGSGSGAGADFGWVG